MRDSNFDLAQYGYNYGCLSDNEDTFEEAKSGLTKIISKYGLEAAPCLLHGVTSKAAECAADVVCKISGDQDEDCKYAKGVADAIALGEDLLSKDKNNNGSVESPEALKQRIVNEANVRAAEIIKTYKTIKCSDLTDSEKIDLTNKLNDCEELFFSVGMKSEFEEMLKGLTCDVKSEFGCPEKIDGTNEKMTIFSAEPDCKTNYFKE